MMTQTEALEILKCGRNVFLTGEPGSGKTFTVDSYLYWLSERGVAAAITASTGIAATHIGGQTIHSWCGLGIRQTIDDEDIARMHPSVSKRVQRAKVLILDEVSMLSAATLDAVDTMCRGLRFNPLPFGGLQVVFVGDFFQLPPVSRDEQAVFAFQSKAWASAKPHVCYLSEQHRQSEKSYTDALAAIRKGTVSDTERTFFESRKKPPGPGAVLLFSHNADVDRINEEALVRLPGQIFTHTMRARGPDAPVQALLRGCISPETLRLKLGAAVMFTKNNAELGWVNGTLGTVVDSFRDAKDQHLFPVVRLRDGREFVVEYAEWTVAAPDRKTTLASISQIPLRLAYAITTHKSQGMTLDAAHVDLSKAFEYGQGYVALSRVRTMAGLTLAGLNTRALEVHPDVVRVDGKMRGLSTQVRDYIRTREPGVVQAMQEKFVRDSDGYPSTAPPTSREAPRPAPFALTAPSAPVTSLAKSKSKSKMSRGSP